MLASLSAFVFRVQRLLFCFPTNVGRRVYQYVTRLCEYWLRIVGIRVLDTASVRCQQRYEYRRLESEAHIRLVELLPSAPGSAVKCRLHCLPIGSDIRPYTAISYAWGSLEVSKVAVECDGLTALVPRSLYSALQRIASLPDQSQFLWADALCIDQGEDDVAIKEKNAQVRMMDQIFASASEVIVDLGDCDTTELEVLQVLDRYQKVPASLSPWDHPRSRDSDIPRQILRLEAYELPAATSPFWHSFACFMDRPWFRRVWILQEFALAASVTFMIGTHNRPESFLQDAILRATVHLLDLHSIERFSISRAQFEALEKVVWHIDSSRLAIHRLNTVRHRIRNTRSFAELLYSSRLVFKASDTRDRAYALLGLAADEDIKQKLTIDYGESFSGLELRVAQYLLRSGFGIFPLYCTVGDVCGSISWAFSLERVREDRFAALVEPTGFVRPPVYNASHPSRFKAWSSQRRMNGLMLKGWIPDVVVDLTDTSLPSASDLSAPVELRQQNPWLYSTREWMISVAIRCGFDKNVFKNACWRALAADLTKTEAGSGYVRMSDWNQTDARIGAVDLAFEVTSKSSTASSHHHLGDEGILHLKLWAEALEFAFGRKLGCTLDGLVCLLPADARKGDSIAIVQGCQIPFILRWNQDIHGEYFRIVGCAYVHGLMDGEIERQDQYELRDIEIC